MISPAIFVPVQLFCCCFFCHSGVFLPQVFYLCFAHLSPWCLLCHGTVNVSDGDSSPPDERSSTGCRVYFVILPSLSLSVSSISGAGERASLSFFIWWPSLHTLARREKGLRQTTLQLFKGNSSTLTRPNIYLRPPTATLIPLFSVSITWQRHTLADRYHLLCNLEWLMSSVQAACKAVM